MIKNWKLAYKIYQKTLDTYFGETLRHSNKAVQFLNDQIIKFVPKSENPPNTPEISCIEDFKGIKGEVYTDDWEAENLAQLRTRILIRFKNVDQEYILNLGESTRRRIYPIKRFGLVEIR